MAGVNIDWAQVKPAADFVGDYVNAFKAGQSLAQARPASVAPVKPVGNAFAPPAEARAPASPLPIAAMTAAQRAAAAQRAEAMASILSGLAGASGDPAVRLGMARHLAARIPGLGIDPAAIRAADVSDEGLSGHLASIAQVRGALDGPEEGAPQAS